MVFCIRINCDGTLNLDGCRKLCWLTRDARADGVGNMDLELFDMLCGLQRWAAHNGVSTVVNVTSGLRTEKTNAAIEGAARNSLH